MAETATTGASELRALARDRIAPRAAAIDAAAEYPWDVRELLAAHDLLGLPSGSPELLVAIEEVARACASSAMILVLQELGTLPIRRFGSERQQRSWLPRCASGEWAPALALAERRPMTAERDGDWFVLDGTKRAVANAGIADVYVAFAQSSAFVVEADRPGLTVGAREPTVGLRGCPVASVTFAEVRVPSEHRLAGRSIARETLRGARACWGAHAVGLAQRVVDEVAAPLPRLAAKVDDARARLHRGEAVAPSLAIDVVLEAMRGGYAGDRALRDAAQLTAISA